MVARLRRVRAQQLTRLASLGLGALGLGLELFACACELGLKCALALGRVFGRLSALRLKLGVAVGRALHLGVQALRILLIQPRLVCARLELATNVRKLPLQKGARAAPRPRHAQPAPPG